MDVLKATLCFLLTYLTFLHKTDGSYVGCYKEAGPYRHFSRSPGPYSPDKVTIKECQNLCVNWNHEYAAMADGMFCFCADDLSDSKNLAGDDMCISQCPDGSTDKCGTQYYVAVFRTAGDIKELKLEPTSTTGAIGEIFSPMQFTFLADMKFGAADMTYSFDYGDGAGTTKLNQTDMEKKIFTMPGEKVVSVNAVHQSGLVKGKKYSIKVLSQAPAKNITLDCPILVATTEEFTCKASVVSGSQVTVNMDWKDGNMDSFPVADSIFHSAGPAVPNVETDELTHTLTTATVNLMPESEFRSGGILYAFEYFTNNGTDGSLEILVLRPTCSGAKVYCHKTKNCQGLCTENYGSVSCTGAGDSLCAASGTCTRNCMPSRLTSTSVEYEIVKIYTIVNPVADSYGYYEVVDMERFVLNPGDILGYKSGAGNSGPGDIFIRRRVLRRNEVSDLLMGSATSSVTTKYTTSSLSTSINGKNMLRGIATRLSWIKFYHIYNNIGQYNVHVNICTEFINTCAEDTFLITAVLGIDYIILEPQPFGKTGSSLNFTVLPHTGSNVVYYWDFGDGATVNTTEMSANHTYSNRGDYNITVRGDNGISSKENITLITIEDCVENITVVNIPAKSKFNHSLQFQGSSGSDFQCYWEFGDSGTKFSTNESVPITGGQISYKYANPGNYPVKVNCSNDVCFDLHTHDQVVQDEILGLDVLKKGGILGENIKIEFFITQGTDVNYTVILENQQLNLANYDNVALTGYTEDVTGGSQVGLLNLTINAWNLVSQVQLMINFTIEARIMNPSSTADKFFILKGQSVSFTGMAESGTSIGIYWYYKDGTPDEQFITGPMSVWPLNQQISKTHVFNVSGTFNVDVVVKNNFNVSTFTHVIDVFSLVGNLTLDSPKAVEFTTGQGSTSFWFTAEKEAPFKTNVHFDWGDGTTSLYTNIGVFPTVYTHVYNTPQNFTVTANVSNLLGYNIYTNMVRVQDSVGNLGVSLEPPHAVNNNGVTLGVSMDKGSDVTIIVDWGDSSPLETWKRTGVSSADVDNVTHTYTAVGVYHIDVMAINNVGNATTSYTIYVQNPVTNDYNMTSSPPVYFIPTGDNTMTFTLTYPSGLALPTNASLLINPGDGSNMTEIALPFYDQVPDPYVYMFNHSFTRPGGYIVSAMVKNLVSQFTLTLPVAFMFEDSLVNPYSNADRNVILKGESVNFTAGVESGTVLEVYWDFDDGTPPILDAFTPFNPFPVNQSIMKTHTFDVPGTFEVNVLIKNNFNLSIITHTVDVYNVVANLTLDSPGAVEFVNGLGFINFWFTTAFEAPTKATVVFDWGDGTTSTYQGCEMFPKLYNYTFTAPQRYTVTANVTNLISSAVYTTVVMKALPVVNLGIIMTPAHTIPNKDVTAAIHMDKGSGVTLVVNWNDGSTFDKWNRVGIHPWDMDNKTHKYTNLGTYDIDVTAVTLFGNTTKKYFIFVQNPVTDDFQLTATPAAFFNPGGINQVTFTLTYPTGFTLPSDASMVVDFADGNVLTVPVLPFYTQSPGRYSFVFSHVFDNPGSYDVSLTIKNYASQKTFNAHAGLYISLSNIDGQPLWQRYLGPYEPGLTATKDHFRLDKPVIFNMSSIGTAVKWKVLSVANNGTVENYNFTIAPFSMLFSHAGTWDVTVTAWNELQEMSVKFTPVMFEAPVGLSVTDNGVSAKPNTPKVFHFTFEEISSDTCLIVDWGDSLRELYSDDSNCAVINGLSSSGTIEKVMSLSHIYSNGGKYVVAANASNAYWYSYTSLSFWISKFDCNAPTLSIEDNKLSTDYSMPIHHLRSEQLHIVSYVTLQCSVTLDNKKEWIVEKLDSNLKVQKTIDLSSLSSFYSNFNPELFIPPITLDIGLYRLRLTVQMVSDLFTNNEKFMNEISTYVQIVKTPLVASLAQSGMSFMKRGLNVYNIFNALEFSRDPDVDPLGNQGFERFEWKCMDITENMNNKVTQLPLDQAALQSLGDVDKGGCFKQGNGQINISSDSLNFTTNFMKANEVYEFNMTVYKDERSASTLFRMQILPTDPPRIEIRCKNFGYCHPKSDGLHINPSTQVKLEAACNGECEPSLKFEWLMYRKGLVNAWILIEDFNNYITGLANEGNVQNSYEIAIDPKLFAEGYSLYDQMHVYRINLKAWMPFGEIAESATVLKLNRGPTGGKCFINSTFGIAFKDYFKINCDNWQDPDGISKYKYYAMFKDDPVPKEISYSHQKTVIFQLTTGPTYNNCTMEIFAKLYDTKGAYTLHSFGNVKVIPRNDQELKDLVNQLDADEKNEVVRAAREGNLFQANLIFASAASALNSLAMYDKQAYIDVDIASKKTLPGYGPGFTLPPNCAMSPAVSYRANSTTSITEKLSGTYEGDRNQRAMIRTTMVTAVGSMTVETIGDMEVALSSLALITHFPEELNRDGQKACIEAVTKMKKLVDSLAASTPLEDLKSISALLLAVVGNTLEAARFSQFDPTLGDVEQTKQTPYYEYDTDYDSSLPGYQELSVDKAKLAFGLTANTEHETEVMKTIVPDGIAVMLQILRQVNEAMVVNSAQYIVTTPRVEAKIDKNLAGSVTSLTKSIGNSTVHLPSWCDLSPDGNSCHPNDTISVLMIATPTNTLGNIPNDINVPYTSGTVTVDIHDKSGKLLNIANTRSQIKVMIPRNENLNAPLTANHTSKIPYLEENHLFYHSFNITTQNASLHVTIKPDDLSVQFLVLMRWGDFPTLNRTNQAEKTWDVLALIPPNIIQTTSDQEDQTSSADAYNIFVDNIKLDGYMGKVIIGLRQLEPSEFDKYSDTNPPPMPQPGTGQINTSYTFSMYTSGCYFVSTDYNGLWETENCRVMKETTYEKTFCECNHLTTFGGGFLVEPNVVDFNYVFSNMDFLKNITLYMTEIVVAIVYILVAVWARRKDIRDVKKLGVTPLPDNNPKDKYLYEVQIGTGHKQNSATNSKVFLILSGDYDETEVRKLEDSQRDVFRRGALDRFLMATPGPLGSIQYARMWHDNSGSSNYQGWYARYMIINDLQTKEKFFFIINEWFAVEKSDGQIDRLLPVAGRENVGKFDVMFSDRSQKQLSDQHVWFSVMTRPALSRFTRLERVSCCLCILFTSMLGNAMFYDKVPDPVGQNSVTFGPFSFSTEQLYVGVICNLMIFPVNLLIIQIFRKAGPRRKKTSALQEAIEDSSYADLIQTEKSKSKTGDIWQSKESEFDEIESPRSPIVPPLHPVHHPTAISTIEHAIPELKKRKKPFELPWWFRIVGWILLIAIVGVCVAFVTFYGIMFGDRKCKKWITSMLISVLTSVFLTQPIKIFFMALIFSLIIKRINVEEDAQVDEKEVELKPNEMWLHQIPDPEVPLEPRPKHAYRPPDPAMLKEAKEKRLKELRMFDILREILLYSFYVWILLVVSYNFRDPNMFQLKKSLDATILDGGLGNGKASSPDNDFTKILKHTNFFNWMNNTLIPGIRASKWYNGQNALFQRGMIGDRVNRIMGHATLRQLRVKDEYCQMVDYMKVVTTKCRYHYNIKNQDTGNYGVGWKPLVGNSTWSNMKPEYIFRTGPSLDSHSYWAREATYDGGGYVVQLRGSQRQLHEKVAELMQDEWIDDRTRAIFIEFSVYNANVNIFGIATLVAEFIIGGGVMPSYRIEPVNLLKNTAKLNYFVIACEIMMLLFTIFFIVKECRNLYKQRANYFKQFWSWVEICVIVITFVAVTIYFVRWYYAKKLTELFKLTNGNAYMKFQIAGYWNEALTYLMGMLCFLACVKFIRILRFNRRVGMLSSTLRYAAKPLMWFFITFMVMFIAFALFFFLLYHHTMDNFRTVIIAIETLAQMLVGKFNFNAMQEADPVMGPVVFFLYVICVYYVLINMFVSILNDSFSQVRADILQQENDYEMVEYVMDKFKTWTGLENILAQEKTNSDELTETPKLEEKIENFPQKVDLLLEALCNSYENTENFKSVFTYYFGRRNTDADFTAFPTKKKC